jgi:hypothetical protein
MALTGKQRRDLAEAISYAKYGMWKTGAKGDPTINIDRLPGFSPKQTRDLIDQVQKARTDLEVFTKANEEVLKQLKALKDIEKKGAEKLEEAQLQMTEKANYILDVEKALITWHAGIEGKTPGLIQMLKTPDEVKSGEKAGDLIKRISDEFGEEVAGKVAVIIAATRDDLTHYTNVIRNLKIVAKTAGMSPTIIKAAGILDAITNVKEWLAGKAIAGWEKITEWAKAFAVRTGLVKDATGSIKKFVSTNTKALDKLV